VHTALQPYQLDLLIKSYSVVLEHQVSWERTCVAGNLPGMPFYHGEACRYMSDVYVSGMYIESLCIERLAIQP
jgi:hypothetical protein